MSIEVFNEQQRIIQDMLDCGPQAWVLALNHMRDRKIEMTQDMAMFSTELLAQGYLEACELPEPIEVGQWVHYFRPDSLLWWHNKPFGYEYQGVTPCKPWFDYGGLMQDPAPPEGSWDIPEGESDLSEKGKALIRQWKESGDA